MKKYFQSCKTKQEAKKLFRELAKINHPDQGGSTSEMVAIIAEYEIMMKKLPSQKVESNNTENQTEEEFNLHVSEELQNVINNISHLPLDIEVIGTWIWVSLELIHISINLISLLTTLYGVLLKKCILGTWNKLKRDIMENHKKLKKFGLLMVALE